MGVGFFNYFKKGKGAVGKTITSVKPKTKFSEATQTFKKKVEAIDKGLKKGIDDFKSENPNRQITDDQMSKVRSEKKKELVGKETQEFIREKKRKGGRIGFSKGTGRTGVPAMDIKTKISLAKKKKNKKSDFGMLSVKAGIDKNPNPTHADRIAAGKMKDKKKVI